MTIGATTIDLVKETYTTDAVGNQIATEETRTVYAELMPITQSEFFNASTVGLKPEFEFIMNGLDYDGEKYLVYNGKKYKIYRYYLRSDERCELYCELKVGNEND